LLIIVQCTIIMKVIKRYANRRLYDSDTSKTVNLEEVAQFIQQDEEVQIIDSVTGQDITTKILSQTFLKIHETQKNEPLVNFILTALIRESGHGFFLFIKKLVFAGIGLSQMQSRERESLVKALVKMELVHENNQDIFDELSMKGEKEATKFKSQLFNKVQEISRDIENSLSFAFSKIDRSGKLTELSQKIDEISKAVDLLKKEKK